MTDATITLKSNTRPDTSSVDVLLDEILKELHDGLFALGFEITFKIDTFRKRIAEAPDYIETFTTDPE